jgi:CDP-glucose 4,6-dehydratase
MFLGRCGGSEMNPKFWSEKNVLVTGASGLLGSWLVKTLVAQKAEVVALVRDFASDSPLFTSGLYKKVDIVQGRAEDYSVVERAMNEFEIDTCFHLGAQTIVGTANRSPLSTFESNIKGTWTVLEAARNSKLLKRLIVASSDKAYGPHERLPYDEETPLQGRFPYDVSKSCADLLAQAYYATYGLPVGITRCGNFYGGGDLNYNRIIPGTIRSLYLGQRPVIRSDGTYIREYIYVLDAADAYLTLAENLHRNDVSGEAFNFGTEKPASVLELVELITRLYGKSSVKPVILNEAQGEIQKQYLSCEKANRILNWKSHYPLEKGLKETIGWYKEFFRKKYA